MLKFAFSFVLSKEVRGSFEHLRFQDLDCDIQSFHLQVRMSLTQIQQFTALHHVELVPDN